jgi:hypothetical protein
LSSDLVAVARPGSEIGRVADRADQVFGRDVELLEPVLRLTEPEDLAVPSRREKIREDIDTARKKVAEHDLPMHSSKATTT